MPTVSSFIPRFDRIFTPNSDANGNGHSHAWVPVIDALETPDAYLIAVELPGVAPEDIEISFANNMLTVRGNKMPTLEPPTNGERRIHAAERTSGTFERSVRLPDYVEGNRSEATYAHGVLTISIPKTASVVAHKIAIKKG